MQQVSVMRFAVAGAITVTLLFALCWLGALALPAAFSHGFITLFTLAPITSWLALGEGLCSGLLFGFAAGVLLAWSYNVSAWLDRRAH